MTPTSPPEAARQRFAAGTRRTDRMLAVMALVGLSLAVALRVTVAGPVGARSAPAGIVFGLSLLAVAGAVGVGRPSLGMAVWAWGLGGALVLCAVPLWRRMQDGGGSDGHGFAVWAAVVTLVAVAEEVLLRGALFEAVRRWRGENTAIAVGAVAFALLHVPVYGWSVVPLDLAVGVALGVLRVVSGSLAAPAIAHSAADLAGWWLR